MYHEIYIAIEKSEKIQNNYGQKRNRKCAVFMRRASCFISVEFKTWFLPFCIVLYSAFVVDISSLLMGFIIVMVFTMGFTHNLVDLAPKIITKANKYWTRQRTQQPTR